MAVHFKFRSAVAFDSINVEGNGISVVNLKERIVAHKNLGRSNDFDLVITNAESGEEYSENGFVPKNTSVIIKRVPARRAIGTLLVHDDASSAAAVERKLEKHGDATQLAMTSTMDELYDMDDFGVDLYAVDESALTNVEVDENSNTSALLGRNAQEKRFKKETQLVSKDAPSKSSAKGFCHNRAVPPSGYICHRCGEPGHFIQHCPTNGDPAYDVKKIPRQSLAPEDSSKVAAAGSQSNNISSAKDTDKVPPELCCSLCQGIFKEAVMIPCCQYSFCDKCIKQSLMDKSVCPQCGSERSKSVDLLPNVALRQAIDRFTSSQVDPVVPNEGADVESAIKATNVTSQGNPYSIKPIVKTTSTVVVENVPDQAVVDDSVCESAIGSKGQNGLEGSKIMADGGDTSFTGKKKKKTQTRQSSVSDGVTEQTTCKPRKANKFCYLCGSPDHLARHCASNGGDSAGSFPPQRPMFHPATQVPRGITPYAQEMYWPGQPILHVRPLPMAYGEGMYGPCSAMPYASPALPIPPYGVSSFPMYPNPSMHGFMSNIPPMVAPRERPLSREEFMELQERERRRRANQERQESRDLSRESPESVGGEPEPPSSGSEQSLHKQWSDDKHQVQSRRSEHEQNYSKETGSSKVKHKHNRKFVSESHYGNEDFHNRSAEDSQDDTDVLDCRHRSYTNKRISSLKPISSLPKKVSKDTDKPEREDMQSSKSKFSRDGHAHLGKQSSVRHEVLSFEKHDHSKHEASDAAEVSFSSRHKNKRISTDLEGTEKHHSHAYDVNEASTTDSERKRTGKKRHTHMKEDTTQYTTGEETKKKRKHKKHRSEDVKDVSTDSIYDNEACTHKKQKIKHGSDNDPEFSKSRSNRDKGISPMEKNIETGRWQMANGLENEEVSVHKEKSKHKRRHRHHHHHNHHHHH